MTKLKFLMAAGAMAVGLAATANAAIYIKFDGVDGEAKSAEWGRGNTLYLTTEDDPVAVGMLLPAVQAAREAARRPAAKQGRARGFSEFEFTDTSAGLVYTLYDAQAAPAGERQVRVSYRCKDWRSLRTGELAGSDCRAAYGEDGKKGGNVETTWKTEEGES